MTQPSTIGTMTIQIETEDQATQDNAPPTPSDTARHLMAYPDTELDFEHDPELDSEDQNILPIESTDSLDNPIDNDPIEIKDTILPVVNNNTQDLNSPVDFNDHNNSMVTQAETNNSHKESKPIESEDESDSKSFESESIYDLDIDFDVDSDVDSEYDFEELGGQHNSDPTFDYVYNSSISDRTDIKQTVGNSDIGDPHESKTKTIDDNMQDQTNKIDNFRAKDSC